MDRDANRHRRERLGVLSAGTLPGLATPWVMFSYPVGGVNGISEADHSLDGGAAS